MKKLFRNIIIFLLIFFGIFIIFSTLWTVKTFNNVSMDEIIFHLKVPLQGTAEGYVLSFVKQSLLPSILLTYIISIVFLKSWKAKVFLHISLNEREKKLKIFPFDIINRLAIFLSISLLLISCFFSVKFLRLDDYIKSQLHESTFIEEYYVDPKKVGIIFPEKKRNLIYIYLESMEATYMSKSDGGAFEQNVIPELTSLAKSNISFSNGDLLGGALPATGATWTVGAMVAHSSGLPLKIPVDGNSMNQYTEFLPGVTSIGDILEEQGYNNILMLGSDANFGGRKNYFQQHGNYDIWDYNTAIEKGKIPKDYHVWWGYEDEKLFTYAREELTNLSKQDKPFNLTLLTVDTHFEDGYVCRLDKNEYDSQYANVMACSSRQVEQFVKWIQKQDFYENTTIVISGDHLTMDSDFCDNIDDDYQRVIYNAFINSAVTTKNIKNRQFTTMDFFPTTLASLGVKINGDRLALGTNLFSDKKTIVEEVGIDKFNEELGKKSVFYNKQFLYGTR